MGILFSKTLPWLVGPKAILQHCIIHGGQFTWARVVNYIQPAGPRLGRELLLKRVVPSAMHDSAQRVDPPRCHANTRKAILDQISQWILESEDREEWILWMNGAAGAGKSAIMQSIAERCIMEARDALASFFFSKTDPTRDNVAGLVATLAYQLIQQIPQTEEDILRTIEQNPLVFERSLESQFKELILNPLLRIQHLFPRLLFVLGIDGLDECNDTDVQSNLIEVITNLTARNLPIIFIIASRSEPQIVASFKALENTTPNILKKLLLDDVQQTSDDIRTFLNDKFADLKRTHRIGDKLPGDWPRSSVIEKIITKCSGQFIYASLVVTFVSSPRAHPGERLEIVDNLPKLGSKHPIDHLHVLYWQIFSQIPQEDLERVLSIIAFALLAGEPRTAIIEWALHLAPGVVEVALSDLAAVITCESKDGKPHIALRFLHASLSEFLLDGSRSKEYHINSEEYATKLTCIAFARPPVEGATQSMVQLLKITKPSTEVHHALLQFKPTFNELDSIFGSSLLSMFSILIAVKKLIFDDRTVYHHFLDLFFRYLENRSHTDGISRNIRLKRAEKELLEKDNDLRDLFSSLLDAGINFKLRNSYADSFAQRFSGSVRFEEASVLHGVISLVSVL